MTSVALVLGAGGAVGHAWHAGVLEGLREGLGWDARTSDLIVGTSAGSVVAAMLRADVGPTDLYARATGGRVSAAATRRLAGQGRRPMPPPPLTPGRRARTGPASLGLLARTAATPWRLRPGLLAAAALPRGGIDPGIAAGLVGLHPDGWPTAALWICAVRLRDGALVVFGRDGAGSIVGGGVDVGGAVAASCAIPGYFSPVRIGSDDFVDGGAHSPTNADLARGHDLVVVSSSMSLDGAAARRPSPDRLFRLAHRASLQREVGALRRRGQSVVTLQPGAADLAVMGGTASAMDERRREPVARRTRKTTLRRLSSDRLGSLLSRLATSRPAG